MLLMPLGAWAQSEYGLTIAGIPVTSQNAGGIIGDNITGIVTYNADQHALTLEGATIAGSIEVTNENNLTINVIGSNSISSGEYSALKSEAQRIPGPTITFVKAGDGDCSLELHSNNVTVISTQFGGLNYTNLALVVDGVNASYDYQFSGLNYYDSQSQSALPVTYATIMSYLSGEGTEESPYLINTADDLKKFATFVNNGIITTQYVKLENDIDCSTLTGFVPIGSNTPFIGTFEGNNKTISGLTYISESADDIVGLFAVVGTEGGPTGSIYNLVLEDCSFGGGYINGGIVGLMNSGTIQICKVTGNSTISAAVGANNVAGAIVGSNSQGALVGNYYYYSVTTSTQVSSAEEAVVKSGYEERGIGDSDDITADDGAMLYTKQLTITGLGDNCANEGDPGYTPKADYDSSIFYYAPGANVTLYLYPNQGLIPSVTLSYTETGETEPTVVPLEKDPDEDGYAYSFTMPDVDATFAITLTQGYSLYIGNTQVTSANKDDVLGDGKVSFSVGGDVAVIYTLTLNGATITAPIKVGLANLIFDIQGNNTITTSETCIQKMENTNPSLTFKSTSDIVGSLNLKNDNGGIFSDDLYGKITINEEFAMILQYYDKIYSNTYYLTNGMTYEVKLAPSYGVTVGGMQIYEGNAADVIGEGIGDGEQGGMVSFDKETSTLTLNNANLSGIIRSSLPNLIIDLIGNNSISSGGDRALQAGNAVNMTIQSSADVKGLLSMHKGYSSSEKGNFVDDNVNLIISAPLAVISGSLTDDVAKNDYYATIGVNYGITINTNEASVVITNQNRINVLNDENKTVQFDGRNTLILNRADIAGIVIGATSPLNTTDGLTVHLTGNNKITNGTKAIANEGNAMPLTLTTSDVEQGELEYICTTCTLTVANSAFSGFAPIKYNDNLAASLDAEANPQVVTIVAVMEPFVTQPGEEHKNTEDGNGLGLGVDIQQTIAGLSPDAATTLLGEGVIVNKILYTLPGEADGYMVEDGRKVVALNTPMDDDDDYDDIYNVNKILEDIKNGTIQPGTKLGNPTFAERFHGMSFLLPAGYGEITLVVNTYESGELHVKVGNNDPVVISGTTGFEERRIPYALTEASYVFIYNVTSAPSSSRRSAGHRAPGRKETTTVGIKGLSVSASDVSPAPEPALSPVSLKKSDISLDDKGRIIVVNPEVTEIDADAFEGKTGITYIDLSQTGIKDFTFDRTSGAFGGVKAFVYLPAGNNLKEANEPNVVVGSVCQKFEMSDDDRFMAAKDFVAKEVELERLFDTEKTGTVYLPFALDAATAASLGKFYELKGFNEANTTVSMVSVEETKANTPYMFKPAKDKISVDMAEVKADIPGAPVAGKIKFVGTYEIKNICSNVSTQYYCFMADGPMAGKFVHVTETAVKMNPYRAYMEMEGSASSRDFDLMLDGVPTGIQNIKVGTDNNVYYDLSGRRVLYPKKGIYIMNGKKVIIK
jgi:hypothetical protein